MINIYDYETLGQNIWSCPVVCVAAATIDEMRFYSDNPYTWEEFQNACHYMKFDVQDQVERLGFKVEQGTLQWWKDEMRNAPVLKNLLTPSSDDVKIEECIPFLNNVFTPNALTYTRSCMFDHGITSRLHKLLEQEMPYAFWLERDTRSWLEGVVLHMNAQTSDFKNGFMPKDIEDVFVKHDPIDDICADLYRLQTMIRMANDLGD